MRGQAARALRGETRGCWGGIGGTPLVLSHRCAMVWGHGPQLSIHSRRWAQRCPRGAILLSVPHGAGGGQGCVPPAGFGSPHPGVGRGVLSTSYPLPNPKPSQNLLLFPFLGLPHAQGPTFPPCRGKISSVPRLQASFCPPPRQQTIRDVLSLSALHCKTSSARPRQPVNFSPSSE